MRLVKIFSNLLLVALFGTGIGCELPDFGICSNSSGASSSGSGTNCPTSTPAPTPAPTPLSTPSATPSSWVTVDHYQYSSGNGSSAWAIAAGSDGTLYAAGEGSDSKTSRIHWLVRKSSDGGSSWSVVDDYQFGTTTQFQANAVWVSPAGHVFVAGQYLDSTPIWHWIIRKSSDAGVTWANVDDVTSGQYAWVSGITGDASGNIFAVGYFSTGAGEQGAVRESSDDGLTWTTKDNFQLVAGQNTEYVSVTTDSAGNIYVAGAGWNNPGNPGTNFAIVRKSFDHGTTWSTYTNPYNSSDSVFYSIATDQSGNVYAGGTFIEADSKNHWILSKSANQGSTWSVVDDFLVSGSQKSLANAVTVDPSGNLYVAGYGEFSSTSHQWTVRRSSDQGVTWTVSDSYQGYGFQAFGACSDASGNIFVSGRDQSGDVWTVRKKSGSSWINKGVPGFSAGAANGTSLAVDSNGTPYVMYQDVANGSAVSVMKYNGTAWVNVGPAGFTGSTANNNSMTIDSAGVPYVAYQDGVHGQKVTVMKFNGTTWVNVGSVGFSAGAAAGLSIATDPSRVPYVAYRDCGNGCGATVMKFNGSSWVNVGSPGLSSNLPNGASLAIDAGGTPYVTFQDNINNGQKATVMKFNGSTWVNVGPADFSEEVDATPTLAFDPNRVPYIAFDGSHGGTVMKFNGTAWVYVGPDGFSPGTAGDISIAIDSSGIPYVAYIDYQNGQRTTVEKFNGSAWVDVGQIGFSAGIVDYVSFVLGPNNTPFVAYQDQANGNKATVMFYNLIK